MPHDGALSFKNNEFWNTKYSLNDSNESDMQLI